MRSSVFYSYRYAEEQFVTFIIASMVIALICTILSLVLITPESRRAALPKFFQFVHDVFNVKWLLIEKIFKVLYIFSTLFIIVLGFLLIFSSPLGGLLIMLFGPIVIRLFHEMFMLGILAVKSLISIDNKMTASAAAKTDPFSGNLSGKKDSVSFTSAPSPTPKSATCGNCGATLKPGATFCGECGQKTN